MQQNILLYERYHWKTKYQKRVISKKNFTYRLILGVLAPYLRDKKKILDIGCGAGTLSFYMANKGNYVRGIDISPKAVRVCKLTAEVLDLEENTNFRVTEFPKRLITEQFDLVLCSEVLEHLKNDRLAAREIFRTLKCGGTTIVSVPSKNAPLFLLGFAKRFDERVGHLRRYNSHGIVTLLKETGFRVLKIKRSEGILRNFLFVSRLGSLPVRVANKFELVSGLFTLLDNITLKLFGESQIIVVAQKPKKKK